MKKFAAMLFAFLLVAFLATAFNSPGKKEVVKDVGYSLTIDQNVPVMIAVSPVMDYQIVRGVSVPYKGLTNDVLTFSDELSFECNLYYTINQINFELPTLTGFESRPDKYPFACDLGTWERFRV